MRFNQVLAPAAVLFSSALAQDTTTETILTGVTEQSQTTEPTILTGVTEESRTTEPTILTGVTLRSRTTQESILTGVTEVSVSSKPVTTESHGSAYTTVITTDYTTYCPYPTTFIHKNVTYTATTETVLTITNCPCTVTYGPEVIPTEKTRPYPPKISTQPPVQPPPAVTTPVAPPQSPPVAPPPQSPPVAPPAQSPPVAPPVAPPQAPPEAPPQSPPEAPPQAPPQAPPEAPPQAPPAKTIIGNTQTVAPNVPVAPTATQAEVIPTPIVGTANKASAGFGALVVAGVAALMM